MAQAVILKDKHYPVFNWLDCFFSLSFLQNIILFSIVLIKLQSITYSITNLKCIDLVNISLGHKTCFRSGEFSEKTSVYGEFCHILNPHHLCRGHSNFVFWKRESWGEPEAALENRDCLFCCCSGTSDRMQQHVLGQGFPPFSPAVVPPNHSTPQWQWQ